MILKKHCVNDIYVQYNLICECHLKSKSEEIIYFNRFNPLSAFDIHCNLDKYIFNMFFIVYQFQSRCRFTVIIIYIYVFMRVERSFCFYVHSYCICTIYRYIYICMYLKKMFLQSCLYFKVQGLCIMKHLQNTSCILSI